jgi:thiazole synthase ThiGH ThiG subunit
MLDRAILAHREALYPDDLTTLRAVFDDLCQEFAVLPDTDTADSIARELVRLFQTGVTEAAKLMTAVRKRCHIDWKMEASSAA